MLKNHKGIIALFFLGITVLFLTVNSFAVDEIKLSTLFSNLLWEKSDPANKNIYAPGTVPPPPPTTDDSGNVGIGTNAPTEKLDVNGNVNVNGDIKATGFVVGDGASGLKPGITQDIQVVTNVNVDGAGLVTSVSTATLHFEKGVLVDSTTP